MTGTGGTRHGTGDRLGQLDRLGVGSGVGVALDLREPASVRSLRATTRCSTVTGRLPPVRRTAIASPTRTSWPLIRCARTRLPTGTAGCMLPLRTIDGRPAEHVREHQEHRCGQDQREAAHRPTRTAAPLIPPAARREGSLRCRPMGLRSPAMIVVTAAPPQPAQGRLRLDVGIVPRPLNRLPG